MHEFAGLGDDLSSFMPVLATSHCSADGFASITPADFISAASITGARARFLSLRPRGSRRAMARRCLASRHHAAVSQFVRARIFGAMAIERVSRLMKFIPRPSSAAAGRLCILSPRRRSAPTVVVIARAALRKEGFWADLRAIADDCRCRTRATAPALPPVTGALSRYDFCRDGDSDKH